MTFYKIRVALAEGEGQRVELHSMPARPVLLVAYALHPIPPGEYEISATLVNRAWSEISREYTSLDAAIGRMQLWIIRAAEVAARETEIMAQ